MKTSQNQEPATPCVEDSHAALARITASSGFENSARMVRFLTFIVEKTLAGQADQLKEYSLGVEVFDRSESFDPKTDTIVRVEARRLRRKLAEYYAAEGIADPIRIDIPTPGYIPTFTKAESLAKGEPVTRDARPTSPPARSDWKRTLILAAILLGILAGSGYELYFKSKPTETQIDSIAVLPFTDMTAAKDQDYFCDGFTEELINALASTENLRVVARTSSFYFKGKNLDVREIGRQLNAQALVEGSVRRDNGNLRITAQLIRTSDGFHIWSKTYDRKIEDTLLLQREIAELIAGTFQKPIAAQPVKQVSNLEAHDLYLLGRYHWSRFDPEDLHKAVEYYEKAITLEPNSAQTYSGLADAYSYMIDLDIAPTKEILPKARAAADKALELDPNSAEAHTARGLIAHELEWDQDRAQREFLRAMELKPNYAYGIHWHAHYLEYLNRLDDAEREMQRALSIDPLSRIYIVDLAMIRFKQRRLSEAHQGISEAAKIDPDFFLLDLSHAMIYAAERNWPQAMESLAKAHKAIGDDPIYLGSLAQAQGLSGDRAGGLKTLAALKAASTQGYVPDYLIGLAAYALGDPAQGRQAIRRAIEAHSGILLWFRNTPAFDQINADPEGKKLLDRVGLRD